MQQSDKAGSKGPNLSFKTKGLYWCAETLTKLKEDAFTNDQEDDIQKLCCCHNADKMGKVIREKKKKETPQGKLALAPFNFPENYILEPYDIKEKGQVKLVSRGIYH